MQLGPLLLAAASLLLATGTHAVEVAHYNKQNCAGNPITRNVYSNTCATVDRHFKSFKITVHAPAAAAQRLRWFSVNFCGLAGELGCEGVGPNGYPLGKCINVPSTGRALGSSAAPCDW